MMLRVVAPPEWETVFDVLMENGRWLESKGVDQWPLAWLQECLPAVRQSVADGGYRCVEINGEIAAVVEVRHEPEEIWNLDDRPAVYIHKLAVRRRFAGTGLGASIVDVIIAEARIQNLQFVRLDCVASNEHLRRYYQSRGFEFRGEVMDAVLLALFQYNLLPTSTGTAGHP